MSGGESRSYKMYQKQMQEYFENTTQIKQLELFSMQVTIDNGNHEQKILLSVLVKKKEQNVH
jgi:NifU-like protein involved in Fe-S cluster formation